MADVNEEEYHKMYDAVKSVLREMADKGGRDTEKICLAKRADIPLY